MCVCARVCVWPGHFKNLSTFFYFSVLCNLSKSGETFARKRNWMLTNPITSSKCRPFQFRSTNTNVERFYKLNVTSITSDVIVVLCCFVFPYNSYAPTLWVWPKGEKQTQIHGADNVYSRWCIGPGQYGKFYTFLIPTRWLFSFHTQVLRGSLPKIL